VTLVGHCFVGLLWWGGGAEYSLQLTRTYIFHHNMQEMSIFESSWAIYIFEFWGPTTLESFLWRFLSTTSFKRSFINI